MKKVNCNKKCDNNSKIENEKKQKKISNAVNNQVSIKMFDYLLF